mgnify:CR=1 FL=1
MNSHQSPVLAHSIKFTNSVFIIEEFSNKANQIIMLFYWVTKNNTWEVLGNDTCVETMIW